VRYLLRLTRA